MAVVSQLITEFKFVGSEGPLNKYNNSLGKGIGLLAGFTAATLAGGAAIAKWASGVLGAEQNLINLSAETGVAVGKIQELSFAAEVSNSTAGALTSALGALSAKIGDAAQKGSEDFARLGISVRDANGNVRATDEILAQIGARFRTMNLSMAEQRSFAEALGIDTSLLTMLNRTSGEMAQLAQRARDLGTLTKEQTAFAQDYNDSLTVMRYAMDGVRRLAAVGIGPELKSMAESFTTLVENNRDWVINGLKFTVGVLGDFLDMLGRVWPLLAAGAGIFVGLKVATLGWAGAMAILLSPAVIVSALIAGLVLVVDDMIVAFQGGKSIIADFFQDTFDVDIVKAMTAAFDHLKGSLQILWGWMEPIWEAYKDIMSMAESGAVQLFNAGREFFGGSSNQQTSNRSVNQDVRIDVRTSDPVRAGQAAADGLQRQMDDAQTQADRGGM